MEKDKEITPVLFRVWNNNEYNDVIALFPTVPACPHGGSCSSYEHVGQHGAADYYHVISKTRRATPEEYADLKKELESAPYGYNFRVYKRTPYELHQQRRKASLHS